MRHSWITMAALVAVSAAAGIAIVGRPVNDTSFVLDRPDAIGSATSVSAPSDSTATTMASSNTANATTAAPVTTQAVTPSTASSVETTVDSVPSTEDSTPSTEPVPSTEDSTPSTDPVLIDTVPVDPGDSQTLARADVRLVVANGDGRYALATRNGNRLAAAGYTQIDLTDISSTVPATVLYYRPGFGDEALIVAADIGLPDALLQALPVTPVTINDELGDVIVVLGPDALR